MRELRDRTAVALEDVLTAHSEHAMPVVPATDRRRHIHDEIFKRYTGRLGTGAGRALVVTAGVPGAGKTTWLTSRAMADGFLHVDPDDIKADLLEADPGLWGEILGIELPDGRPVRLAELAVLVHHEAQALAERIFRTCLQRGIDVVIHGTLRWEGQGRQLMRWVGESAVEYQRLDIVVIEVPPDVARGQALGRWWEGRTAGGSSARVGRFTPSSAFDGCYREPFAVSLCLAHAIDLFNADDVRLLEASSLTVVNRRTGQEVVSEFSRSNGQGDATPALEDFA